MKKQNHKKLRLAKETVVRLDRLVQVKGGKDASIFWWTVYSTVAACFEPEEPGTGPSECICEA